MDALWPPRLVKQDFIDAAAELGVEPAALHAVADVESSGDGFLPSGLPKVLFEGHIFWSRLKARGIDPQPIHDAHPTICYPRWTRTYYLGGQQEYERYEEAKAINAEAAIESTSWGLFQMMGFNWQACGFTSVEDFLQAHKSGERAHLLAVCRWMRYNGLYRRLQVKDWEMFARGYNGPSYAQNQYDTKLAAAYDKRIADGW